MGKDRLQAPPILPYLVDLASLLTSHPAATSRPAGNVESTDRGLSTLVGPAVDIFPDPDIVSALTKTRAWIISSVTIYTAAHCSLFSHIKADTSDSCLKNRKPVPVPDNSSQTAFFCVEILHERRWVLV